MRINIVQTTCFIFLVFSLIAIVCRQRSPQASDYFKCTQDSFEELEMLWENKNEKGNY
jgi:hypothetical protein